MEKIKRIKVFITVKTYPVPSEKYIETVCTAGVTENYEWIRLYPIDFRYRNFNQKYKKYQWIEVDVKPTGAKDKRQESYRPNVESIKLLNWVSTDKDPLWNRRRQVIENMLVKTLNQLKSKYTINKTSLGIVKPNEIIDFIYTPDEKGWSANQEKALRQELLFDNEKKLLRKIPYKFQYVFKCENDDSIHKLMVTDWELGVLFFKELDSGLSKTEAAEKVKEKYLNEMCNQERDTHFFVGTVYPRNSWIILGVFWPKKESNLLLGL